MSELKAFVARKIDDGSCDPVPCVEVYLKSEADKVIAEKDKDIAYWREEYDKETKLTDALNAEIESLKASHYAESVDAGMRERMLRRALWLARDMRAEAQWNRQLRDAGIAFAIGENKSWDYWNQKQKKWQGVERKCRAKAEEYK